MVLMYGGFLDAQRMVERLFLVPRLVSSAWHLCLCLKVSKPVRFVVLIYRVFL